MAVGEWVAGEGDGEPIKASNNMEGRSICSSFMVVVGGPSIVSNGAEG